MERRSSSDFRPSRPSSGGSALPSRGAGVALVALSCAASAMLLVSPLFAVGASPLVFGATDAPAAALAGVRPPSTALRIGARALASAAWGGAMSAIVATRGAPSPPTRSLIYAFVLLVGAIVGALGAAGGRVDDAPRPVLLESPLVGVCDVSTAGFAFVLSLAAHDASSRTRVVLGLALAMALVLRALLVSSIVARAARATERSALPVIGFVGWLALAAVSCTLAATATTWSGLGAAVILTLAAVAAELRRRRAIVVLLRGSVAFAFAAMLGLATFLST